MGKASLRLILEPRFVYDAAVAAVAVDQLSHSDPTHADVAHETGDVGSSAFDHEVVPQSDMASAPVAVGGGDAPTTVIVVDSRSEERDRLVASVDGGRAVIVVGENQDASAIVSQVLSGKNGVEELRLVGFEGADGTTRLGSSAIDAASVMADATDIASWRDALSDDARIEIEGRGSQLGAAASTLSDLTGVSVEVTSGNADEGRTLVVIDSRVDDIDTLTSGLSSDAELLIVGEGDDGLALIAEALSSGGFSSVQILAHGSDGELTLGRDTLSAASLSGETAAEVASWGAGLTSDADILIYGCDTGAGESGAALVNRLAELTGADVAASDDPTGAADLGGDWTLERSVGSIETSLAISSDAVERWRDLMATPTVAAASATLIVNEDSGANAVAGVTISDADATDALTVTVEASGGTVAAVDNDAADATTVTTSSDSKTVTIRGTDQAAINTILASLTYTPTANSNVDGVVRVYVSDGAATVHTDIAVDITPINDAPTLTVGGSNVTFTAVSEDATTSTGMTVAALLAASGWADNDQQSVSGVANVVSSGIAITGTSSTQGAWQYSTDGTTWTSVGTCSTAGAFLLDSSASIRFIPAADFNGTATLTYRAWDQSDVSDTIKSGASGIDLSLEVGGGTSAYSDVSRTATISVSSVNDTPTLGNPGYASVAEGGTVELTNFAAFGLSDVDMYSLINANPQYASQIIFTLTALPGHGDLYYNGNERLVVGSTFSLADVLNLKITYKHNGYQTTAAGGTSDRFSVSVDDGAGGTVASTQIPIAVTAVNQAPSVSVALDDTAFEGREGVGITVSVSDPDQTSTNYSITFSDVSSGAGTLYRDLNNDGVYGAGDVLIVNGSTYTGTLGGLKLKYDVSGDEPSATAPGFKITVGDDGGGTGTSKTGSATFSIDVTPVNDDPTLTAFTETSDGAATATNTVVETISDGHRSFTFTVDMFGVVDPDSASEGNISFVVSSLDSSMGVFLFKSGSTWYRMKSGDSFTLADVRSGLIAYCETASGTFTNATDSISFQVFDSTLTGFSTVRQSVYSPAREGGARDDGDNNYMTFTLTFDMSGTVSGGSGGPGWDDLSGVSPVSGGDKALTATEGQSVFITTTDLGATDGDSTAEELVYRLTAVPTGGSIQVYVGSGNPATDTDAASWSALALYGSFTQAQVDAGKVRYLHDGSEDLTQSFTYSLSDGDKTHEVVGTVSIDVTPVNDNPTTAISGKAELVERDTNNPAQTAANGYYVFNKGSNVSINLGDVDGSGDKTGDGAYQSDDTRLGFVIDSLPTGGTLQINDGVRWLTIAYDSATSEWVTKYDNGGSWVETSRSANKIEVTKEVLTAQRFRYVHDGGEVFEDEFTIHGVDGWAGASDPVVVKLSIARFNDPVTLGANSGLQVAEGGSGKIGGTGTTGAGTAHSGTGTSILLYTDPDNTTVQRQYRITNTVDHGTLTRDGVVLGVDSVFTQEDLDNGLIVYTHDGSEIFSDAFSFAVTDGGGVTRVGDFAISVLARDQAPTIGSLPSYRMFGTDTIDFTGASLIQISDGDILASGMTADEQDFITVTLQTKIDSVAYTGGHLTLTTIDGIAFLDGTANGDGRLVISGTLAKVNAALASLTYKLDSDMNAVVDLYVTADDRTSATTSNGGTLNEDGSALSDAKNTVTKFIRLYASFSQDTPTATTPATLTVNEDGGLAFDSSNLLRITDADAFSVTESGGAVVLSVTKGTLTIGPNAGGATVETNGTSQVTLRGTLAQINAALLKLTYSPGADYHGADTLTMTVAAKAGTSGLGGSVDTTFTYAITVNPVNDTPTVTSAGNAEQTVGTGSIVFSAANGNLISVADPHDSDTTTTGAFTDSVTVTLTLSGDDTGVLALSQTTGLTSWSGGTKTLTLTGKLADVNAALNGLRYTASSADLDTTVTLTITIDDLADGGTTLTGGVGAALTAAATVKLLVSSDNDAPVLTVPAAVSVAEDSSANGVSGLSIADVDIFDANTLSVTLSVAHGKLVSGSSGPLASITLTGTLTQVNAALAALKYTPNANYFGSDTLTVTATDGSATAAQQTVAITVTAVNDQPTAAVGSVSLAAVSEDTAAGDIAGVTLSSLLAAKYTDPTDTQTSVGGGDSATPLTYVAITGNASIAAQGVWQVQIGGAWVTVPTSFSGKALVVAADALVRFVPAANFEGTPGSLTVRLGDASVVVATSASASDLKTVTSTVTGTWSSTTVTVATTVTNVNDAPTATALTLTAVNEDSATATFDAGAGTYTITGGTSFTLSAAGVGASYSDAIDNRSSIAGGGNVSTALGGVAIVGTSADPATQGTWYYSTDGSTWRAITVASDAAAILLPTTAKLCFVPVADYNGTPGTLSVRYSDAAVAYSASSNISGDITTTGHWSNASTIGTSVNPLNDAPVLSGTATNPTIAENSGAGSGTASVHLLSAAAVSDVDFADSSFGGGTITVSFDAFVAGDVLSLDTTKYTSSWVTSTSGGTASNLVINLAAGATESNVADILKAVQYRSTSDNPTVYGTDTTRVYTISFTDGNNNALAGGPASLASATTLTGTITITPDNDPPTAVADAKSLTENTATVTGNARTNDTDLDDANATLTVSAVRFGATDGSVGSDLSGVYGKLNIASGGAYIYTLDTARADVQALRVGQTLTEVFTYTIKDSANQTSSATITITITGVNDGPVGVADALNAVEDGGAVQMNVLTNDTDADSGDTKTVSALAGVALSGGTASKAGVYGSFQITSAGVVTYTIDNASASVQALKAGETVTDSVTYTVKDADGVDSTATVTVTVTGVNDAPVAVADTGSVAEDGTSTSTGNVLTNDTDVDHDATKAVTALTFGGVAKSLGSDFAATYGTFRLTSAGAWTYTLDNAAVQFLGLNETRTETFAYTVTDDQGATSSSTLTVTITGANDAPVVTVSTGNSDVGSVTEDVGVVSGKLSAGGTLSLADVDLIDAHTVSVSSTGTLGVLTASVAADTTGAGTGTLSWSYGVDNSAVQYLAAGQTRTETFTLTVGDGKGGTTTKNVVVTITGADDVPVVVVAATNATGGVTEDATTPSLTSTGTITITDGDLSDTHTVTAITPTGTTLGTLTSAAVNNTHTGTDTVGWSYTVPNASVQYLAVGQTRVETFTVTLSDGQGGTVDQVVTVTITGTNDAPTISTAATSGAVSEDASVGGDGKLSSQGTISFGDVDLTDAHTVTPALQSTTATGGVALGTLTVVKNSDTTGLGTGGGLTWTYSVDNSAVQYLAAGQTVTQVYRVTVDDGHGGTVYRDVTITVTGTNDAPVANPDTGTTTADAPAPITGNVLTNDTDRDTTDTHTVQAVSFGATGGTLGSALNGAYGALTLNANGTWSYTVDKTKPAVVALAADETLTEVFSYTNGDGHGGAASSTLTITVTGANVAPTVAVDAGEINEDATSPSTGNVLSNDTDANTHDTHSVTVVKFGATTGTVGTALNGTYGALTLAADGAWSYAIDNSKPVVQALAVGETLTEVFTYTNSDNHGGSTPTTLTITIRGVNDIPVAANDTGSIAEDQAGSATGNVLTNDTDVDTHDTHSVTALSFNGSPATVGVPLTTAYGTMTLNANGAWSYTVDNTKSVVQALAVGETLTETLIYTVADNHGGTDTAQLVVTINGANDLPVVVADTATINRDASAPVGGNVLTNDTDVDTHDTHVVSAVTFGATSGTVGSALSGDHGALTLNANGTWSYALDTSDPAVRAMTLGQTLTETFTYTNRDSAGGISTSTLTITIYGPNHTPTVEAASNATGAVTEDATAPILTNAGTLVFSDADTTDTHTVTATPVGTTLGALTATMTSDTTGSGTGGAVAWTYTVPNAAVQYLAAGQTKTETFKVVIDDGRADGARERFVTVTITGTNDVPTVAVTSDLVGSVTEDASTPTLTDTGIVSLGDVDLADGHTVTVTPNGSALGTLTASVSTDTTGTGSGGVTWTYAVSNAAVQYLAVGQTKIETFTVTVDDGHGGAVARDVTVTITGTNDVPTAAVSSDLVGSVTEDASTPTLTDTGIVSLGDVDLADGHTVTVTPNGSALGTLTASVSTDATGTGSGGVTWTYAVSNAAVQYLAVGQTKIETFTVTVDDGHGGSVARDVAVTITGTNDAPTATGSGSTAVTTGGQAVSVSVDRSAYADIDTLDTLTFSLTAGDGGPAPSWLTLDPATLTVSGTPTDAQVGATTVRVVATDPSGASAWLPVTITVNQGPSATAPATSPTIVSETTTATEPAAASTVASDTLITSASTATALPSTSDTAVVGSVFGVSTGAIPSLSTGLSSGLGGDAVAVADTLRLSGDADVLLSTSSFLRQFGAENLELFLSGSVGNQLMQSQMQTAFQVPPQVFHHTNPGEPLAFQAVRPDGSPLPNWLAFDARNLTFRGTPPTDAAGNLDVLVVAKDARGNQAAAQFRILIAHDVNEARAGGPGRAPAAESPPATGEVAPAPTGEPTTGEATAPETGNRADATPFPAGGRLAGFGGAETVADGRASLSDQVRGAGATGLLADARALLNSLLAALDNDRDAA